MYSEKVSAVISHYLYDLYLLDNFGFKHKARLDHLCFALCFVEENFRSKGLGTILLSRIEHEAKKAGSTIAHTDTFDWQAKDFYLKFGYEIFGIIENAPEGHKRYYLKKAL